MNSLPLSKLVQAMGKEVLAHVVDCGAYTLLEAPQNVDNVSLFVANFANCAMNQEFIEKARSVFDLSGRVAIITGAAGGLGRLITFSLVAFGARVVLASRNLDNLKKVEEKVQELGGEAIAIATDITQEDQVDHMVSETLERFGKIDILVNNSGITYRVPAEETSLEGWHKVMETNVTGAFLCSQRVGRVMISQKKGKIINISSVRGAFGRTTPDFSTYCTSKGALDALTRALACEWGRYDIQVNSLAPCLVETDPSRPYANPIYAKKIIERIPLGRWAQPHDLIGSVIFLASDASNFVNGQTLYVDGGYSVSD